MTGKCAIDVVAGLIWKEDRILAGQRKEGGPFSGKWEFPGGKVEEGEERVAALSRELKEELGILVLSASEIFNNDHFYSEEFGVHLTFFLVREYRGRVRNLGFQRLTWVAVRDITTLDFLDGDRPLIEKLLRGEIAGRL